MEIEVLSITSPRKNNILANASVKITFETHSIIIADWRILKNKSDDIWLAGPSYSIAEGRNWRYEPTITLSRELQAMVSAAILDAYDRQRPTKSNWYQAG